MLNVIMTFLSGLLSAFRGRKSLVAENLALRHQLMVIQRQVKKLELFLGMLRQWPSKKLLADLLPDAFTHKYLGSSYGRQLEEP